MKNIAVKLYLIRFRIGVICTFLTLLISCKKESILEESKLDVNYFVNHDNPNDPVDHAIYEFYKKTGVASFYNDTIATVKISKKAESAERYKYITIDLGYQLTGFSSVNATSLQSKALIPAVLELLETLVLPRLPEEYFIPCFYFIEQYKDDQFIKFRIDQGRSSYFGFDCVGIVVKDVAAMNASERKIYAASILAGMAFKKIAIVEAEELQSDFFSISRELFKRPDGMDVYIGLPYMLLGLTEAPAPEKYAFLNHFIFPFLEIMELESLPTEQADLRNFLTAALRYTPAEFNILYASHPLILKKFNIVRVLVQKAGFKLPI